MRRRCSRTAAHGTSISLRLLGASSGHPENQSVTPREEDQRPDCAHTSRARACGLALNAPYRPESVPMATGRATLGHAYSALKTRALSTGRARPARWTRIHKRGVRLDARGTGPRVGVARVHKRRVMTDDGGCSPCGEYDAAQGCPVGCFSESGQGACTVMGVCPNDTKPTPDGRGCESCNAARDTDSEESDTAFERRCLTGVGCGFDGTACASCEQWGASSCPEGCFSASGSGVCTAPGPCDHGKKPTPNGRGCEPCTAARRTLETDDEYAQRCNSGTGCIRNGTTCGGPLLVMTPITLQPGFQF
jgi:hypothetical protein